MLERTAPTVVSSTEALAVEEARALSFVVQASKFLKFMNEIEMPDDIIDHVYSR